MPRKGGGLPKKYIKQAGGINKKAWRLYRASKRKRGKRKSPARAKRSRPKKRSNPRGNLTTNKTPKIGASVQAFKGSHAILAPVIEVGVVEGINPQTNIPSLQARLNLPYAGSLGIEAVNQAVDRKTAHATALSGGSLTAWAAEGFAAVQAFNAARGKSARDAAQAVNTSLSHTIRAYDPPSGQLVLADDDFKIYQGLRVGGGIVRRLSNMGVFAKLARPLKRLLSSFGGRL